MTGPSDGDDGITRRTLLERAGTTSMAALLGAALSDAALATPVEPDDLGTGPSPSFDESTASKQVFPESVASGDPTTSGAVVWTRVDPDVYTPDQPLILQVARDEAITDVVENYWVDPDELGPEHDFTVKVDLDGELSPASTYYYRFVYDGTSSRTGRFRTLPPADETPDSVRLAVLACQDFRAGFYGTFRYVAEADVDYMLHLGDFIYEWMGGSHYDDRWIIIPSEEWTAMGLRDYRALYRRYRSDPYLRRALERHALIATWDDHEIVNNRYWSYEEGRPYAGPGDHPKNDDAAFMRQLFADGIQAWVEYLPVRVRYDPDADRVIDQLELWRSFRFGDLVDLVVTDERLFRSGPGADVGFGARTETTRQPPDETRTMLGDEQREWFLDRVADDGTTWTAWANEVLHMAFDTSGALGSFYNPDAWDGFEYERRRIDTHLREHDVDNFVTLTGDMHTTLAGYVQTAYGPDADGDRVGVEFMTPAVTSPNLKETLDLPGGASYEAAVQREVLDSNPHLEFFNSHHWGYSVVEFTPDACTFSVYAVDKTVPAPQADRELLKRFRVPEGDVVIEDVTDEAEGAWDDGRQALVAVRRIRFRWGR
ncbi:alkaline phosphatase D family protein [Halobacteriaceae archaeon GCM10025711]